MEGAINERFWAEAPFQDHACNRCRINTPVEGEDFLTQAAAIDGNVSTRFFKVRHVFQASRACGSPLSRRGARGFQLFLWFFRWSAEFVQLATPQLLYSFD